MAVTMNARWDNSGTVIPGGDAEYVVAEQPIAEYDNWFNHNIVADVQAVIDDVINKFNANTILKADTDNTPIALTVSDQTLVGRAGGGIAALTSTQSRTLLNVADGAIADIVEDTSPQLGGDLDLNGKEIIADTTPGTNVTASGIKGVFTNGNTGAVAFGDICYMAADGHLEFADADSITTMPGLYMALGTITAASSGEWLIMGIVRDDAWSWTIGAGTLGLIYVSTIGTTGNTLTQTAPSGTGDQVQIVGHALSATTMMFNPDYTYVEVS